MSASESVTDPFYSFIQVEEEDITWISDYVDYVQYVIT